MKHEYAELEGVRLHYVEEGEGPLVVLLHGFPEAWFGWERQIPMLTAAGFRVVAPDMRGYNLSDKPKGWRSYERARLSGDVAALIRHLGAEKAHVVGHDWGAIVAWYTAIDHPEVVERLVALDACHPLKIRWALRNPRQLLKSWYVLIFLIPRLPELIVSARDWRMMREPFENDARAGAFGPEDIERYVETWSRPRAITTMLNYYRAGVRSFRRGLTQEANPPVQAPTMVIWGENDRYGLPALATPDREWVPNLERVEILPGASHWVQHDEPERVGQLLTEFLRG